MVREPIFDYGHIHFTIRMNHQGNGIFYHTNHQFAQLMGMSQDSICGAFTQDILNHAVERKISKLCSHFYNEDSFESKDAIIDFGDNKYRIQISFIKRIDLHTLVRFSGKKLPSGSTKSSLDTIEPEYYAKIPGISTRGIAVLLVEGENDFTVKDINVPKERLTKIKLENIYGKSLRQLLPPNKLKSFIDACITCVQTKSDIQFSQRYGKTLLLTTFRPSIANNQVERIIATNVDISKLVRQNHRLKSENRELRGYENILRDQLQLEQLLSKASREFLVAGHKGFNDCLHMLIKELGRMMQADQVLAVKFNDLKNEVKQWVRKKEFLLSELHQFLLAKNSGEWRSFFKRNKLLVINDTNDQRSDENAPLRKVLTQDGVKSIITVPIRWGNEYWGALFIAQIDSGRMWTTYDVNALKLAAQTIMSAVLRAQHENRIEESNRVLIEYDESLQQVMAVEETLYNITKRFLIEGQIDFDACANDMLKKLGELSHVDRLCLYLFQATDNSMYKKYQWNNKGISPSIEGIDLNATMDIQSWFNYHSVLVADNTLEDMDGFPPSITEKMLSSGIKSFLMYRYWRSKVYAAR